MASPVVDGMGIQDTIQISADGVTLQGLNVTNGSTGVLITSSHNNITGNVITYNKFGIDVYSSDNNMTGNFINDNVHEGISVIGNTIDVSNILISGNIVDRNTFANIYLYNTSNANVTGNEASDSSPNNYGIYLLNSDNNNLTLNNANKDSLGICLSNSNKNNLSENTANLNDDYGIERGHR